MERRSALGWTATSGHHRERDAVVASAATRDDPAILGRLWRAVSSKTPHSQEVLAGNFGEEGVAPDRPGRPLTRVLQLGLAPALAAVETHLGAGDPPVAAKDNATQPDRRPGSDRLVQVWLVKSRADGYYEVRSPSLLLVEPLDVPVHHF